jgi:transcriptional regulator with XRE-family HTH domain
METLLNLKLDHTKLKARRGELPLTDVAKKVGVSRQQLWNYENGMCDPPVDVVARLCRLYDCSLENFTSAG